MADLQEWACHPTPALTSPHNPNPTPKPKPNPNPNPSPEPEPDSCRMGVPALAYTVQGNLLFVALAHLEAPTYQVRTHP